MSDSQIDLSWTDASSDETGFEVQRSMDGTSWMSVAALGAGATAYNDTGLQPDTTYHYQVLAFNASGYSSPSNQVSATTQPAHVVTLHVGDLDGSAASGRPGRWNAVVTVTVHNASHGPVAGATVSGGWSGGANGGGSCTTDGSGACTISKTGIKTSVDNVTFSVTGASMASAVYEPSLNHDPDSDSDGTVITINQP
jgi:hypothetical protein